MRFKKNVHPLRLLALGVICLLSACGGDSPDETSPALTLNAEPPAFTFVPTLALSGKAEAGARVEFEREPQGASVAPAFGPEWQTGIPLVDGGNTITITATDDAGNTWVIRRGIVFAEYIAGHTPAAGDEVSAPSEIEIVFATDVRADSVKVAVSGAEGEITPKEGTARTFIWKPAPATPLKAGQDYTVTVSPVTDAAGRTYSAAYQWTFKTAP